MSDAQQPALDAPAAEVAREENAQDVSATFDYEASLGAGGGSIAFEALPSSLGLGPVTAGLAGTKRKADDELESSEPKAARGAEPEGGAGGASRRRSTYRPSLVALNLAPASAPGSDVKSFSVKFCESAWSPQFFHGATHVSDFGPTFWERTLGEKMQEAVLTASGEMSCFLDGMNTGGAWGYAATEAAVRSQWDGLCDEVGRDFRIACWLGSPNWAGELYATTSGNADADVAHASYEAAKLLSLDPFFLKTVPAQGLVDAVIKSEAPEGAGGAGPSTSTTATYNFELAYLLFFHAGGDDEIAAQKTELRRTLWRECPASAAALLAALESPEGRDTVSATQLADFIAERA